METKIITLKAPYQTEVIQNMMQTYRESTGYAQWSGTRVSDFEESMEKPGAICLVQLERENVIGFAQGYQVPACQECDPFDKVKMRPLFSGEYFFIERIVINAYWRWQDASKKLVQQILDAQPYQEVLLWIKKESPVFEVVAGMGGKQIMCTQRGVWSFMQISTKK